MRWLLGVLLFALAACTTVNITPYRELNLPPTADVEVLRTEPAREYELLAEMWMPSNDKNGVLKMRKKAMEIGADALLLVGERTAGAIAIPLQGVPGGALAAPINRTYAVAIRYKR